MIRVEAIDDSMRNKEASEIKSSLCRVDASNSSQGVFSFFTVA